MIKIKLIGYLSINEIYIMEFDLFGEVGGKIDLENYKWDEIGKIGKIEG